MTLKTKIKLTPKFNYTSIFIEDISGTGITGYGANQDPAGYRRTTDVLKSQITATAPNGTITTINLDITAAANLIASGYTLLNTSVGYPASGVLSDGLWKIEYVPYFVLAAAPTLASPNTLHFTPSIVNNLEYANATWLSILHGAGITTYYKILSIDYTTGIITFNGSITDAFISASVGLGIILYVPIAKGIKEHLDNKVADIPAKIGTRDSSGLVDKYLLYDAMFINCEKGNGAKAQQIFDLLTIYSSNGY